MNFAIDKLHCLKRGNVGLCAYAQGVVDALVDVRLAPLKIMETNVIRLKISETN